MQKQPEHVRAAIRIPNNRDDLGTTIRRSIVSSLIHSNRATPALLTQKERSCA